MIKSKTQFERKLILEDKINSGGNIKGLTGFVPMKVDCCIGSTKLYVPVVISGIILGDCEFAVEVMNLSSDVFQLQDVKFTINPKSFFQSKDEIIAYEKHLTAIRGYEQAVRPMRPHNSTLARSRVLFKKAMENTTVELRSTIIEELGGEAKSLNETSREFLETWYKKMMLIKSFPDANLDDDEPTDDEDGF